MKGSFYASDTEYARQRLNSTIVRLDGTPIVVRNVGNNGKVAYTLLGSHIERVCDLSDIDMTPIPLGNVNSTVRNFYVKRTPERRYKQGFDCRYIDKSVDVIHLSKCIRGIYPTFSSCVENIYNRECFSKAFSRKLSLKTDSPKSTDTPKIKVVFKECVIGSFDLKKEIMELDKFFEKFKDEFDGVKDVPDFRFVS